MCTQQNLNAGDVHRPMMSQCVDGVLAIVRLFLYTELGHPPVPHRHAVLHRAVTCSIDTDPVVCLWLVCPAASYVLCYSHVVSTCTSASPSSTLQATCALLLSRHRRNLRPTPSCCELGQSTMNRMKSLQLEQLFDHIF